LEEEKVKKLPCWRELSLKMSPFYTERDRTNLTRALTFLPVVTKNLPCGIDESQVICKHD